MTANKDFLKTTAVDPQEAAPWRGIVRVLAQRRISSTGYELVLERGDLAFTAGRLVTIHGRDVTEDRSYTIASGEQDERLHILYRLVPTGALTPQLIQLQAGDELELSGPYGQFTLRDPMRPIFFLATGTGIAPCRAFCRTHPDLALTVVHGVRTPDELFYREEFESRYRYQPCCSRTAHDAYQGRVTQFMAEQDTPPTTHYYLCGAYEMIYEMQALLHAKGVPNEHIFIEGYYYRLEV